MKGVDPLSLPRIAPSSLGPKPRVRRRPDRNGIPDRANTYRKEDRELLGSIVLRAFADHVDALAPPAEREAAIAALIAEVDRIYPPAEMEILQRYGFAIPVSTIYITLPRCMIDFAIPTRMVPHKRAFILCFSMKPDSPTPGPPADALPYLELLAAVHLRRHDEFSAATGWASWGAVQKNPPTWGEIEDRYPRLGAWMARQRGDA